MNKIVANYARITAEDLEARVESLSKKYAGCVKMAQHIQDELGVFTAALNLARELGEFRDMRHAQVSDVIGNMRATLASILQGESAASYLPDQLNVVLQAVKREVQDEPSDN